MLDYHLYVKYHLYIGLEKRIGITFSHSPTTDQCRITVLLFKILNRLGQTLDKQQEAIRKASKK